MRKMGIPRLSASIFSVAFLVTSFSECLAQPTWPGSGAVPEVTRAAESAPQAFNSLPVGFESQFLVNSAKRFSGRIAFSSEIDGHWRIFVLDLDSLRVRRLVDGPGDNNYPAWSPDGTQLAFASNRDGNKEIYLADWRGADQRRLTNDSTSDDSPWWSPDGKQLVITKGTKPGSEEGDSNIALVDAQNGKITTLTNLKGRNSVPRWGPGKHSVTFSTNRFWPGWDVCEWNMNDGKENCVLSGAKSYCRAAWSPKFDRLAYSEGAFDQINLGILEVSSGKRTIVSALEGKNYDPVFSADGSMVAFVAENGVKDHFSLFVVTPGSKPIQLIKSKHSIRYISWTATKTIDLESQRILNEEAEQMRLQAEKEALSSQASALSASPSPTVSATK